MSDELFLLNVPINRHDVVKWLQSVPSEKLPPVVENTLAAGNLALSLLQVSTGEESMQRFLRPVLEPMNSLRNTIEGILRVTQRSQRLGQLGEDIVAEQLKACFPADDFQLVSAQDHQADIHAHFAVNNGEHRTALIEVKFHSDDVAGHEVEKFRRDLQQTGFKFGLMVSLTSRLTGITGPLHLEETPNHLAVYLPNAGVDGHRLLCATAMLKAVALYQARTPHPIPTGAIEQAWKRLNAEVQELEKVAAEIHELRTSLHSVQQTVTGAFGKLTEKAISAECQLRYALDRITNRLTEELTGLRRTTDAIALLPPSEPDTVLGFIAELRKAKDARLRAFEAVYDLVRRIGLRIRLNGGQWQLLRDGALAAWTEGTKTRVDACVPLDHANSPQVSIDVRVEKLKNSHVVISGSVPEQMLARLEQRLVNDAFASSVAEVVRFAAIESESGGD